ncbi:MAG: CAP domain-containing protein [Acidimicrobiales bacterium]|nr:CAP domain-containing protein [Acidimicrobiales bacterium]
MTVCSRRLVGAVLVVLAVLALAACMSAEERSSFDRVNGLRAQRGLPALAEDRELVDKARAWAQVLAAEGGLRHSDLHQGTTPGRWGALAENVGFAGPGADVAGLVLAVQRAFEGSPTHLANQLDGRYTHAGVGVARSADGRVFVVQELAAAR